MKVKLLKKVREQYSIHKVVLNISKLDKVTKFQKFGYEYVDKNRYTFYELLFEDKELVTRKTLSDAKTFMLMHIKDKHGSHKIISKEKVYY